MKSAFLPSKGLLCLYDKQNNTWLLVDMEFLFSCSTRHLTRSLRSLVSYRVKHSKRNSISTRTHVLFPISFSLSFLLHFHSSAKILLHVLNGSDCLAFGFTTLAGANANYLHVIALNFFLYDSHVNILRKAE